VRNCGTIWTRVFKTIILIPQFNTGSGSGALLAFDNGQGTYKLVSEPWSATLAVLSGGGGNHSIEPPCLGRASASASS
jgi:hypothetical protein